MTDPIGDMLTRIRNSSATGRKTVKVLCSKTNEGIAEILAAAGFLRGVSREERDLVLSLGYDGRNEPLISHIKRVSKPGLRIYSRSTKLPSIRGRKGLVIVSTPKGLMTSSEARKKGMGGEVICEVW